jgi:hypothetical protein
MKTKVTPPDIDTVLRGLKPFQRDTVDYVFRRLFTDSDATRRFLVADEVGLGKTLVARGVVAHAINYLWEKVERVDVIYICSNSSIAHQNINRLNVTGQKDFQIASRMTLLPVTVRNLKKNKLNFISFTPGTSFNLRSNLGTMDERALLYWLLDHAWGLRGARPLNVLQGNAYTKNFRDHVQWFRQEHDIDETLADEFATSLDRHITQQQQDGHRTIRARFKDLCQRFQRIRKDRKNIPDQDAWDRNNFVGELRTLLATTCLSELQPDLIILDEFQQFRNLLDGTDEASSLARGFFEQPNVRILLLSATPYKMLTLQQEQEDDRGHYGDFIQTVRFLQNNPAQTDQFERLLDDRHQEMLQREVEQTLRRIMVRTERLAVTTNRNGMLHHVPSSNMRLEPEEVATYLQLQKLARILSQNDTMEYWKSAPYLLNFMDGYEFKVAFEEALGTSDQSVLRSTLRESQGVLLSPEDVAAYRQIDPGNARLRAMAEDVIQNGLWKTLWLPPCFPYYQLGEPFSAAPVTSFTKRLVFSAWRVVPRAISALLSYEVERRIFTTLDARPQNTPEARKRRRPLLRFARAKGRFTGMPLLTLIYPCKTLARDFCPFETLAARQASGAVPPIQPLVEEMRAKIEARLQKVGSGRVKSGAEDESWYWAAPLLLDLQSEKAATREWFDQPDLAQQWAGSDAESPEGEETTRWADHLQEARNFVQGERRRLGRAPKDLALVLAHMALAGPATVAFRSMNRICGGWSRTRTKAPRLAVRNAAAQVGWAFLHLFNLPESTALLRGMNATEPYWQRVLEYCVNGCLQATIDEYIHLLKESLGVMDKPPAEIAAEIAEEVCSALTLRTSTLGIDYIGVGERSLKTEVDGPGMRCHFALRFGDEKSEEERGIVRANQVRTAFNSPFWPFVLVTTSIGQEGLDFHPYCHAVVHWNLPANPVDLEQREGRVHRYKGHAVRKNLALKYGSSAMQSATTDPWDQLFQAGTDGSPNARTGLVPFWVFDIPNGAKIERHVPALPLSRDLDKLQRLQQSLAVYRMVFGQPRQEDLLAFLLTQFTPEKAAQLADELRVDLSPPAGCDSRIGERGMYHQP